MNIIRIFATIKFILASQDDELGGIADRPGDWIDPFHTLFGLAGELEICFSVLPL